MFIVWLCSVVVNSSHLSLVHFHNNGDCIGSSSISFDVGEIGL